MPKIMKKNKSALQISKTSLTEGEADLIVKEIASKVADYEKEYESQSFTAKLFGYKLAAGGYRRILMDTSLTAIDKLHALHREAKKLKELPQFRSPANTHEVIYHLSMSDVVVPSSRLKY